MNRVLNAMSVMSLILCSLKQVLRLTFMPGTLRVSLDWFPVSRFTVYVWGGRVDTASCPQCVLLICSIAGAGQILHCRVTLL